MPRWDGARAGIWSAFVLLTLMVLPASAAASFTATLDRGVLNAGEEAKLSLTFQDGTPPDIPAVPRVPNLSIDYQGQSSQFNFINGRSSSLFSYNFAVRAAQPGDYLIPAIRVEVDGRTLTSDPLKLKVLKRNEAPPPAEAAGKDAFLKLVVPKTEVYLGEVLPVEIQFYWRQAKPRRAPQLAQDGFTIGKTVQQPQRVATINNQYYYVITFSTFVVPAKTGPLKLGPATMPVAIPGPNARVDFWGNIVDWNETTVSSEALTINTLPLPTNNVPADYTGAVGRFSLTASVSTNVVTVGDPITLDIQIGGHGPIESLALPSLDRWGEFKLYPPVTKVETTDQFGLDGTKTFEQVVIPENAEIRQLPPITFSFFDPDQKTYRTVTHPATPITVHAGNAAPAQPTVIAGAAQNQGENRPATDIVHIKQHLGMLAQIRPPLIRQTWFVGLQGVPVLAWLIAFGWRRRQDRLANNPRLRRHREVAQTVRDGLVDLRRLAGGNQAEDFFATVFRLLQEQLGERLDLPASAITESVIEEQLKGRGVTNETASALDELFQICNRARYAPQRTSEELATLVPKVESALQLLQGLDFNGR